MSDPTGGSLARERTLPASPVRLIPTDPDVPVPAPGIALCLSGGGYRAMLFHLGALRRINELGYLPRLDRVSSVSGGSITAGALAMNWGLLEFDGSGVARGFAEMVERPIRALAGRTIDVGAILRGLRSLGRSGSQTAHFYARYLYGRTSLQDLPDRPDFIFNSTSLQSGVLWRFSKRYMADYRVGLIEKPAVALSVAVAASSAFPPFLSPVLLDLTGFRFQDGSGTVLQSAPYTAQARLADGGVYDNLGLEPAWKKFETILVSDGSARVGPEPRPALSWPLQVYRVLNLIDAQVGSLRKRQVIDSLSSGQRQGAYWGIASHIDHYGCDGALPCPPESTSLLAAYPTRLARVDGAVQERLINWGYAVCDAALRTHVEPGAAAPAEFPYPARGVG